jgi:hypothetical protein
MNKDFVEGMKVSLDGEFGVVIKSDTKNPDLYGIIIWDTNKENDFEDWRGQFGSFIQIGGKVLNANYLFQFINDDGSKKI